MREQNIYSQKIQVLESEKAKEVMNLQSIIKKLRNQIDINLSDHEADIQKVTRKLQNENQLLKESASRIREKLEKNQQKYQSDIQKKLSDQENFQIFKSKPF